MGRPPPPAQPQPGGAANAAAALVADSIGDCCTAAFLVGFCSHDFMIPPHYASAPLIRCCSASLGGLRLGVQRSDRGPGRCTSEFNNKQGGESARRGVFCTRRSLGAWRRPCSRRTVHLGHPSVEKSRFLAALGGRCGPESHTGEVRATLMHSESCIHRFVQSALAGGVELSKGSGGNTSRGADLDGGATSI